MTPTASDNCAYLLSLGMGLCCRLRSQAALLSLLVLPLTPHRSFRSGLRLNVVRHGDGGWGPGTHTQGCHRRIEEQFFIDASIHAWARSCRVDSGLCLDHPNSVIDNERHTSTHDTDQATFAQTTYRLSLASYLRLRCGRLRCPLLPCHLFVLQALALAGAFLLLLYGLPAAQEDTRT